MSADITYKSLVVCDNGFSWNQTAYRFDDVKNLHWYRRHTTVRVNFVRSHTEDDFWLTIFTVDGAKFPLHAHDSDSVFTLIYKQIRDTDPWKNPCAVLRQAHAALAEKTFGARSCIYLSQLAQNDHFNYSGSEFSQDGWVTNGKSRFQINRCSVTRSSYHVTFTPIDKAEVKPGLFQRMWSGPARIVVKTSTDQDVFFALLHKLYGLRWDN